MLTKPNFCLCNSLSIECEYDEDNNPLFEYVYLKEKMALDINEVAGFRKCRFNFKDEPSENDPYYTVIILKSGQTVATDIEFEALCERVYTSYYHKLGMTEN